MKIVKLTCYSGVGTVTGANFMLEFPKSRVLVDCGLLQGDPHATEINNAPFEYDPASVDYLFVTHAHMDHIGRVPKLLRDGFKGTIYSTPSTKQIAELMFDDAIGIMEYNARQGGTEPMYSRVDADRALSQWKTVSYYHTESFPDFSISLKDAGHILGSAMYEFDCDGEKIVCTGDLGNSPTPLLRDTDVITDARYVLMESVYGDRNHEAKSERDERFKKILKTTLERGGTVVIPVFSLERTQVILYEINNLVEGKEIPSVPVFLDSPLAIKVTKVYEEMSKNFNNDVKQKIKAGDDIFNFPKLSFTMMSRESRKINKVKGPKIICAGSGMSTGGRVTSHEADYLPGAENTVLLVGYQSLGTLGRELQDGTRSVMIHEKKVPVRAQIEKIEGFSSHKDSDHLVDFVSHSVGTLKKVFVAMGEPKSSMFLAQRIRDELDVDALYPERKKSYKLN